MKYLFRKNQRALPHALSHALSHVLSHVFVVFMLASCCLMFGGLVCGGLALAFTPTLDRTTIIEYLKSLTNDDGALVYTDDQIAAISSAYDVTDITEKLANKTDDEKNTIKGNYYTTFTVLEVDGGDITEKSYGLLFNTQESETKASIAELITSYSGDYIITQNTNETAISFSVTISGNNTTFYVVDSRQYYR